MTGNVHEIAGDIAGDSSVIVVGLDKEAQAYKTSEIVKYEIWQGEIRQEYPASTWIELYRTFCSVVAERYPEAFGKLDIKRPNKGTPLMSRDRYAIRPDGKDTEEVRSLPGFYIDIKLPNPYKVSVMRQILRGIGPNNIRIVIYLKY